MRVWPAALFALLLIGSAATAEETASSAAPKVDFSRDSLLRVLHAEVGESEREPKVRYHVGAVEFRAFGSRWRFNYLPIMTPISGTRLGITNELPDPFSLSGTPIATPRRAWQTRRQIDAELKRINASEKKRSKIKVDVKVQ